MPNLIFKDQQGHPIQKIIFNKTVVSGQLSQPASQIINISSDDIGVFSFSIAQPNLNGFSIVILPNQTAEIGKDSRTNSINVQISFNPFNSGNSHPESRSTQNFVIQSVEIRTGSNSTTPDIHVVGNASLIRQGELEIYYINTNPPGNDVQGEVLWIVNRTSEIIDLYGCEITQKVFHTFGGSSEESFFKFADNLLLPPASGTNQLNVCSVFTKAGVSTAGSFTRFAGSIRPVWNNTGDTATLYNNTDFSNSEKGTLIYQATYGKGEYFFDGLPRKFEMPQVHVVNRFSVPPISNAKWDGTGSLVNTNIELVTGDVIRFSNVGGSIWPGWLGLPPDLGPEGINYDNFLWPARTVQMDGGLWPYADAPDAFAFCLIAKIMEFRPNGDVNEITTFHIPIFTIMNPTFEFTFSRAVPGVYKLFLGINDFRLYGTRPLLGIIDGIGFLTCDILLNP